MSISNRSLEELIECAEKLDNFCVLAPNYENTTYFNNYVGKDFELKIFPKKIQKYKLKKVDFIDNSFFMLTKKAKKYLFDEKYFLYSENLDFCLKLKKNSKIIIFLKRLNLNIMYQTRLIKNMVWCQN